MSTFRMITNKISKEFFILSEILMFLLAATVFYNVIMRYIFRMPISWSTELSAYAVVMITFLSAPEIENRKAHIKFTLFTDHLSPRKSSLTEIISTFVALFYCFVLLWQGGKVVYMAYTQHMSSPSLFKMPLSISYSFLPLGAAFLSLVLLVRVIDDIRHLSKAVNNE